VYTKESLIFCPIESVRPSFRNLAVRLSVPLSAVNRWRVSNETNFDRLRNSNRIDEIFSKARFQKADKNQFSGAAKLAYK
jgi:hypothetical protein